MNTQEKYFNLTEDLRSNISSAFSEVLPITEVQLVSSPLCMEFYQLTFFHPGVNAERIRIWLLLPVCWHDHNFKATCYYGDSNSILGIAIHHELDDSGSNPCMGKKIFFSPYPTSHLSVGIGAASRQKSDLGLALNTQPHLASRLEKE